MCSYALIDTNIRKTYKLTTELSRESSDLAGLSEALLSNEKNTQKCNVKYTKFLRRFIFMHLH